MITRQSSRLVLLAAALQIAACGRLLDGSASPTAKSSLSATTNLAGGRVSALPSGPLFVRVVEFEQDPGGSFTSQKHVPGFVYIGDGVHRLIIIDGPSIDLSAGEAYSSVVSAIFNQPSAGAEPLVFRGAVAHIGSLGAAG